MPEASELDRAVESTEVRLVAKTPAVASEAPLPSTRSASGVLERAGSPTTMVRVPSRRRRPSPILISLGVLVILPTLLAGTYFAFFATRSYVAEFRATVRSVQPAMEASGVSALLGIAGSSQSTNDANAVVQFLESRDALEAIDKSVGLRSQYASPDIDWLSRLRDSDTIEGFLRYWQHQLQVYFESTTGTIVVKTFAFSPQIALATAQAALSQSEDLVNRLSMRTRNDTVSFAERTVGEAEQRLSAANERLRVVQNQEKLLDPQKEAASTLALSAKLKDQLAGLNSVLALQQSYMNAAAPSVRITLEQIASLQREIDKLSATTTDTGVGYSKPLSSVLGTFDQAETERGFAEKSYAAALAALQTARIEANRQQVYLATIVRPELPQEASFPKPLLDTLTVFGIALMLWLIGLLSAFAIKEHV